MPKVSPAHRAARRQQILAAALTCFAREGFHRTTMQDIQREARLSPGLTYLYFASKDGVIEAIADERHARERALIEEAHEEHDLRAALQVLAHAFFGALEAPEERISRRVGVQIWAEALRNPRILAIVHRGVDAPRHLLADLLKEAQQRHEVPASLDPEVLARVLIALFQGFILQQAWDDQIDPASYLAAIETTFSLLRGSQQGGDR